MGEIDREYSINLSHTETFELIKLLENTIEHIWAVIPLKTLEVDEHKKKMSKYAEKIKNGKSNFFLNFEESYLTAKNKVYEIQKEIYSLNRKKEKLNKLYLRLSQSYYSDKKFMLETTEDNYNRWMTNLSY
tara:strand:+ start:126 stop:518 length:393 start_codon:yes stop_codon:yes gene_type:complete